MLVRDCDEIFGILRIPEKKSAHLGQLIIYLFFNFPVIQEHKSLVYQACYAQTEAVHQSLKTIGIDSVTNYTRCSTNRRVSLFNCRVGMIPRGATEAALQERLITRTSPSRF